MSKSILTKLKALLLHIPSNKFEIINLLKQATKSGFLEANTLSMLEGVLDVQDTRVTDVMVPRLQMVTLDHDMQLHTIISLMIQHEHSRFPVLGENKDEVLGIILAKDLLGYCLNSGKQSFNMLDVLRPAVFIPESKRLNVLLQDFRLNHNHMAMVVDEYGRIIGLITIEDVLEQIVGEISDEYDIDDAPAIRSQTDGSYTVKALTSVEEFNEYFSCDIDAENIETIGGLVTRAFGYLPKRGESVIVGTFTFSILRADFRRIHLLSVVNNKPQVGAI
jgi:Putative Mg2+ and Co2+ transporter CorC